MKKNIFFVSLIAMMAVSGAYADVASTTYVGQALEGREVTSDKLITVDAYNANKTNTAKYVSAPVLGAVIDSAVDGLATVTELEAEQAARVALAGRVGTVEVALNGLTDETGAFLATAQGYADTAKSEAIEAAKTETTNQVKALAEGAVATNAADIAAIKDEEDGILATAKSYADGKAGAAQSAAIAAAKTETTNQVKELAEGAVAKNTAEIANLKTTAGASADKALEDANAYTDAEIAKLDVAVTTGDGVVKQIAQADGKIVPTKAKVANADIADDAAIAQSKISGLETALAAKIPAPLDSETSSTGTYVLTYTPGTGYAWESIGRE